MNKYCVVSFYKFIKINQIIELKKDLLDLCQKNAIYGTILLANEGINASLCGDKKNLDVVLFFLQNYFNGEFECKYADTSFIPFRKLKVLIKKEIVTFGVPGLQPSLKTGQLVSPKAWNALINDPSVVLVDTRNSYEVEMGSFKGARDPKTSSFGEFPEYVEKHLNKNTHKKIAMFCTGGIRCEKASAYLLEQGFESVYQLEGGILKYLKEVDPKESLWIGKCFVFDERISVQEDQFSLERDNR